MVFRVAPNIIGMKDGKPIIGRYAWKATAPTLRIQAANAFSNDIGMSTPINPKHEGDCTKFQPECMKGPHGDSPQFEGMEIDSNMLNMLDAYLRGLKPPVSKETEGKTGLCRYRLCIVSHPFLTYEKR